MATTNKTTQQTFANEIKSVLAEAKEAAEREHGPGCALLDIAKPSRRLLAALDTLGAITLRHPLGCFVSLGGPEKDHRPDVFVELKRSSPDKLFSERFPEDAKFFFTRVKVDR